MPIIAGLGRSAPDYGLIKKKVDDVLLQNNIIAPPILPKELAENYRLKVVFAGFPDELFDVMGYFDLERREIVVNRRDPPNRQTFTIAHELGHALLHEAFIRHSPNEYKVLRREPMGSKKSAVEQEANSFASGLLVPRKLLDNYYRLASISELSTLFGVSEEVIRWRLLNEFNLKAA